MEPGPLKAALERDESGWAREHLANDIVAWLTTVAADGMPQSSVICFMWDGDSIFFYSKPDTPKLRNIARSPEVSFHLQSDPYGDHALIIEGTAEPDPTVASSDVHPTYRVKYREPFVHWGMEEADVARDFSVPIRITPRRVRLG